VHAASAAVAVALATACMLQQFEWLTSICWAFGGCIRVYGWLLEADVWRVVRFPAHEWRLLMQDRGAQGGSTMAYVYNPFDAGGGFVNMDNHS
jgi:hypothetical protein